ncbi:MAG: OmpH family outer membrane protein [Nitrospira sp.]|nr:OmpH family outer membrane protein [Nitrospira sp.]
MRKTIAMVFLLFFTIFVMPYFSEAADSVKIGVVDLQKVVDESEAGKKATEDLNTLAKSKRSLIDEKGKAIEKLKSELEKQSSVLSDETKKSKNEELEKLFREYQRILQDSDAELRKKDAELKKMILREIFEIAEKFGVEEGYTLVVDKGFILYSNKDADITDKLIKKYNESKATSKKQ